MFGILAFTAFALFYLDEDIQKNEKIQKDGIARHQVLKKVSSSNEAAAINTSPVDSHFPAIHNDDKKMHPEIEERRTASIAQLPKSLRSSKFEEMLMAEAEVFEKIDWSHIQETVFKDESRRGKKIELAPGINAIQFQEDFNEGLVEVISYHEERKKLSRATWSLPDGATKIITYQMGTQIDDEHQYSYKEGQLYRSDHFYNGYRYELSYDSNRKIIGCIRQKMTTISSDTLSFGEEEKCE